ncbi:ArsR/SmtB family transcription factor [Pantoea dispersa]|uniref:Transcriptional regulator n=1 Tax=Pantoea dispersa TaxID=59814 RepID=A0A8E1RVH4_9GAMM|nr:metalloregulator ArsR/SmtB family transcription factor [Pantoea dispersa]KTR87856.1 transcriptional regulator [Pantoea dispersa]KTR98679.1 transcriptional regulator [Pantoea dispersa]KTS20779.1 transcriptional regulator [Pantoea dispersa]KTS32297.1 transcriptional regulator [Pantoea dispersa]KTS51439.1 transcriptional regulator [Pantoea dispersa]
MNITLQLQESALRATTLLKSMSNTRRLLILCVLIDKPGTSSGDLCKLTGLTPSATSQHLAKMKEDGLIESERVAQRINYFIKDDAVKKVISALKEIYCTEEFK